MVVYSAAGSYKPLTTSILQEHLISRVKGSFFLILKFFITKAICITPTLANDTVLVTPAYHLQISYTDDRSNSTRLEGTAIDQGTPIYVFIEPEVDINKATFYFNDTLEQTEFVAPFDLAGTTDNSELANAFDTDNLTIDILHRSEERRLGKDCRFRMGR